MRVTVKCGSWRWAPWHRTPGLNRRHPAEHPDFTGNVLSKNLFKGSLGGAWLECGTVPASIQMNAKGKMQPVITPEVFEDYRGKAIGQIRFMRRNVKAIENRKVSRDQKGSLEKEPPSMVTSSAILNASILIVDDVPTNVELLERMLQLAGYTSVASTTNPFEVCGLHRENQYDLILLDLMMPGMDGFQVMECLTEIEEGEFGGFLSVLVVTGQPGHKLRALQLGAKDVISKPFEALEMLARVRNMLEIRLLNKEAKKQGRILEQLVEDLQKQIITDPLTNLYNRRFLQEYLPQEIAKAKRTSSSLAVLMFDLDFFKRINDEFGHEAGDEFLKSVATLLRGCIRESDIACRYGGEEFVLVLSGASLDGAMRKAEKIRNDVMKLDLTVREKPLGRVSTSIGIAVYPEHGIEMEALLRAADEALYEAKENGRNRVVASEPRNEEVQ